MIDADETNPPFRRESDHRIAALEERASVIERKIDENTAITKEVADILATFRVMGNLAKWTSAIAAAFSAVYAALKIGGK